MPVKILLLPLLVCLLLTQCKKEDEIDKLPPPSSVGAQTFGCLINGKAWPGEEYYMDGSGYSNGYFYLQCETLDNLAMTVEDVHFEFEGEIYKPGTYIIPYKRGSKLNSFGAIYRGNGYNSFYSPSGFAIIRVTRLDTINHYMSGNFEFTLESPMTSTPLKVTSGRFDYRYD